MLTLLCSLMQDKYICPTPILDYLLVSVHICIEYICTYSICIILNYQLYSLITDHKLEFRLMTRFKNNNMLLSKPFKDI